MGRLLAIGDVHGCADALRALIEQLQLAPDDTLVMVGDLVDKGPDSRDVINQLMTLDCRLVLVMGNHDQALLDALDRRAAGVAQWEGLEQYQTFRSYAGVENIPSEHIEFLRSALPFWETDRHVFVHANVQPGVPLAEQDRYWLQMRYLKGNEQPLPSGQRVVCGHTIQNSGVPWVLDGWLCIDTAAFHGGWLTCIDLDTDELVQTSQTGEVRRGTLAELGRHEPKHPPSAALDDSAPVTSWQTNGFQNEVLLLVALFVTVVAAALYALSL